MQMNRRFYLISSDEKVKFSVHILIISDD